VFEKLKRYTPKPDVMQQQPVMSREHEKEKGDESVGELYESRDENGHLQIVEVLQ